MREKGNTYDTIIKTYRCMKKTILFLSMLFPFCVISQNITGITPNQAMQGQTIPLIISGNNMDFSGWSCWSNTGNLSDFRFSQWSGMPPLYGASTSATATQLNGNLSVPAFQSIGVYNLEVFNCFTASWVLFPNSFQINLATSTLLENIADINIHPNPAKDIINIQFMNLITEDIKITIVNSVGKLVFFDNIDSHTGKYTEKIDFSSNAKGIYFLKIETGNGIINKKLIILH